MSSNTIRLIPFSKKYNARTGLGGDESDKVTLGIKARRRILERDQSSLLPHPSPLEIVETEVYGQPSRTLEDNGEQNTPSMPVQTSREKCTFHVIIHQEQHYCQHLLG